MKAIIELISDIDQQKPSIIPLFKKTERRLLSVFMGALDIIPEYRGDFLKLLGYKSGKTCTYTSLMEAQYRQPKYPAWQPDGLVTCVRGSSNWSVFFEAKADDVIKPQQMQNYAELASSLDVDAVVSISNEFAREASELPYNLPNSKRRKRDMFHFSWADIRTFTTLFLDNNNKCNSTEIQILQQVLNFFWQKESGIQTYDAMPKDWSRFVESARDVRGLGFQSNTSGVTDIIHGWQQERRDLNAKLISLSKKRVRSLHETGAKSGQEERLKFDRNQLANDYILSASYLFPDAKTNLKVLADLSSCKISSALEILPPERKKAKATVTWLIRLLAELDNRNLFVSFDWKGRGKDAINSYSDLENKIDLICEGQKDAPKTIRLIREYHDVRSFKSRTKFIEQLESLVLSQAKNAIQVGIV